MLEHEMGKVAIQLPRHIKMGNENENAEHQVFVFSPPTEWSSENHTLKHTYLVISNQRLKVRHN